MCLGIPGRVIEMVAGYGDQLALVEVAGAVRKVNIGLLDEAPPPGQWVLIHMGFAVELTDAEGAEQAMSGLELMGRRGTRTGDRDRSGTGPVRALRIPAQLARVLRPGRFRRTVRVRRRRGRRRRAACDGAAVRRRVALSGADRGGHGRDRSAGSPGGRGLLDRQPAAGPGGHARGGELDGGPIPAMAGARFASLTEGVLAGGVPHHSFAVFCIYPYTGLLTDRRKAPHALTVLDRCRIRWGQVQAVRAIRSSWSAGRSPGTGSCSPSGPPGTETVVQSVDGVGMVGGLKPGDWVVAALGVGVRPDHRRAARPVAPVHRAPPARSSTTGGPARRFRFCSADGGGSGQLRTSVQPSGRRGMHAAARLSRTRTSPSGPATSIVGVRAAEPDRWTRRQWATEPGPSRPHEHIARPSGARDDGGRAGEPCGEQVDGLVVDLLGACPPGGAVLVQQCDTVGQPERFLGVMRGVEAAAPVSPRCASSSSRNTPRTKVSRCAVGSSKRYSDGRRASALASPTRCCSPPESSAG